MSHWYDSTPKKRDSNPGSSAPEADALQLGQQGGEAERQKKRKTTESRKAAEEMNRTERAGDNLLRFQGRRQTYFIRLSSTTGNLSYPCRASLYSSSKVFYSPYLFHPCFQDPPPLPHPVLPNFIRSIIHFTSLIL